MLVYLGLRQLKVQSGVIGHNEYILQFIVFLAKEV